MSFSIRIATLKDAKLIAEMSQKTFYETFSGHNSKENMEKFLNEQFSIKMLMDEVSDNSNYFSLLNYRNSPVGYLFMRNKDVPELIKNFRNLEIARIYIVKEMIGKGAGKTLMEHAFSIAIKEKIEVLWLGVWEFNHRAIHFYKKLGFEKFGSHVFMLGDDPQVDWLMKKNIN